MDRSIPLLLIGLVFGGGIGFTVAAANGVTLGGHDHADPAHHAGAASHDHAALLSLPQGPDAPTLDVNLTRDPVAGWNLHMRTANFAFAPQSAGLAHRAGQGHAHVYVNGAKIGRFYGPWVHLDALPDGPVEVAVTLNANDHRALAVNGTPVARRLTIDN
ncbi:hypothetical protein OCGS_0466 [Oceaniovalibus guishaninsula JLT2003]|uniref:Uncharacterized protein n=1 Tax=Oceaniovalibus guishaninsula JLT2003 TaxID=1231392 RepID=K2GRU6_9RHOB|nr:hypothetical protein [Oceaniovalibus guishaninsula]EKE45376.1 hypothetical protein OCGS_0466 [Oceaniovalibus guishaninsula JLT2003]